MQVTPEIALGERRPRVVHVATSHEADDVRVFDKECRSLAGSGRYDVLLAAAGRIPAGSGVGLVPLRDIPSGRVRRFTAGPRKAVALTGSLDVDLWHFHDPELLPVALGLALSGAPVIWDAHEDYQAQMEEEGGKAWIPGPARGVVRRGTNALLRAVDRHAAGIVAATPTIAERYRNPRTVVVGNEARMDTFANCSPSFGARRVLFTGAASSYNLFPEIVAAVASFDDVTLVVAGREPDPELWRAAKATLGSRLVYVGWLDRAALAQQMSDSSVGLTTYRDLPTKNVSSPVKFFEFCAAGLPIVTTPTHSCKRMIEDGAGGFVAPAFTADAITQALTEALSDEERWTRASADGRRWAVKEGSWSRSEAQLLALYDEILSNPASLDH